MRTSHKLTRLLLALMSLVSLAGAALAQQVNSTAPVGAGSQPEVTNQAVNPPTQNGGIYPFPAPGVPITAREAGNFPTPQPPGYRGNWNNENGVSAFSTPPGVNNGGALRSIGLNPNPADPPAQVQVSDQKLGSLLVYPYYTSNQAQGANTWVTISNVSNVAVTVHIFFIEGVGCTQADQFICLTANASVQLKASEFDPDIARGWILAVAVDVNGRPTQRNVLSGNAFVNNGSTVQGNYGAEAFTAYNNAPTTANVAGAIAPNAQIGIPFHAAALAGDPSCRVKLEDAAAIPGQVDYISLHGYNANNYIPGLFDDLGTTATLNFTGPPTFCSATDTNKEPFGAVLTDPVLNMILRTFQLNGGGYDFVPNRFAVEIQSPEDVPGQEIITVGLNGDLSTAATSGGAQSGTGTVVNGNETPFGSFVNFITGRCQSRGVIANDAPRVPRGMNQIIKRGEVGVMQFSVLSGAVGIIITPRSNKGTAGIRTLHKTNVNTAAVGGGTQNVVVQADPNGTAPTTIVGRAAIRRYGLGLTIPIYQPPACPPLP